MPAFKTRLPNSRELSEEKPAETTQCSSTASPLSIFERLFAWKFPVINTTAGSGPASDSAGRKITTDRTLLPQMISTLENFGRETLKFWKPRFARKRAPKRESRAANGAFREIKNGA